MLGFSSISEVAFAQLPGDFVYLSGVNTTGIAGDETVIGEAVVSGFSATGAVGTLGDESVVGKANVSLIGFSATLSQGDVILWGMVIPGVTTTYTNVSTSNSPTWSTVSTGASQTWTEKVA
jgi:hypothetical protein|tara:strand:+ start:2973 stop:3335 length:363 start_codon:yes stop_codon:yes gene_type:complete